MLYKLLCDSNQRATMACPRLVNHHLLLHLLIQILAVQSVIQNVKRRSNGDIFSNPDDKNCKSDFCWTYKNIKIGGIVDGDCKCSCSYEYTFVVDNTTCVENSKVHSDLIASIPAKDGSLRVTRKNYCNLEHTFSEMPVLDVTRSSNRTLCLTGTAITNCNIVKEGSKYFYKGEWYRIWPTDRKQDTFTITDSEDDDRTILKWTPLSQQFTGLIFGLKISCQLKDSNSDDTFGSYLIFKSAGWHYFDDNKPTLAPISSAPTSEANGPSPTTHSSTTASPSVKSGKGNNSSRSQDKGLIAGVTICVILVIMIVIIAVVVYYLRRRRRRSDEKPSEAAKCEANPTYEVGQDRTIPVTVNGQTPAYDYPDTSSGYQPLVQNTRMRDASGKVPVYTPLNRETKNDNPLVLQTEPPGKRGLAYETVAIPIQPPATTEADLAESPDYEDPTNPTIPNEGGLYAVSKPQDGNTIDFENTAYSDPDSIIKIG